MFNSTSLESNSSHPPNVSAIGETFGAILIGTAIALVVYGFSLIQAVRYFRLYRVDTKFIRSLVYLTLTLDLAHTGLSINACCWRLVTNHSDIDGLFRSYWSFQSFNLVSVVIVIVCQSFYARRVYRALGPRFIWVTLLAAASMICTLALAILLTIDGTRSRDFLVEKNVNWVLAWLYGSAVITDITLTSALVIKLTRSRTGWKQTDSIIRSIVTNTVSSGLLISVIASVCFLFTIIQSGNLIYIGISNIAAKVYVFSVLTAIKSRKSFSMRLMEDAPLGRPALTTSPAWTRRSPVQLSVDEASVIEFAPVAVLSVNTHTSSSLSTMGHSKRESLAATESDSTVHAQ